MLIRFIVVALFILGWPWLIFGCDAGELVFFRDFYLLFTHPAAPQIMLLIAVILNLLGILFTAREFGSGLAVIRLVVTASLVYGLYLAFPLLRATGVSQPIALMACYMVWATLLDTPFNVMKWSARERKFRRMCQGEIFLRVRQSGYSPVYFFFLLALGSAGVVAAFNHYLWPAVTGSPLGLMVCVSAAAGLALLIYSGEVESRPVIAGGAGILYRDEVLPWTKVKRWKIAKKQRQIVVIQFGGLTYPDEIALRLTEGELARFKETAAPIIDGLIKAREERRAARKKQKALAAPKASGQSAAARQSPGGPVRAPRAKSAPQFSAKPAPAGAPKVYYDESL